MESDLLFPYTVKSLAEYASMSPFNFQRTFKNVVGESAMSHLRRLRLARAALCLKNSGASITQVALEAGFDTHAGFTHAFTKAYGMSPVVFRDNYLIRPYIPLPAPGPCNVDREALAACPLSVRIEKLPTRRLAFMRYVGPMRGMAGMWTKMVDWCNRRGLLHEESILLGIHHDDWDEYDPENYDKYRYDAAIVVDAAFTPDEDVVCTFLPGGETAMVGFQGSLAQMDKTWHRFAYQWLPASGYQPRLSVVFDLYPSRLFLQSRLRQIVSTMRGIDATLCVPISRMPIPLSMPD